MLQGRYLVTGAAGRMGTHALLRMRDVPGVSVRAVNHRRDLSVTGANIESIRGDLTDGAFCRQVVDGVDYVFMFAGILSTAPVMARDPVSHVMRNMMMNIQMLEASYLAGVRKYLWLSSTTGYPMKDGTFVEEDMFRGDPPDGYFSVGWMTRYTEVLCRMYATKLKRSMPVVVLRPSMIYGEHGDFDLETCHFFPAIVRKVVERRKPIEIWGDGEVRRDLLYGDDVFDACLLAMGRDDPYNVFNISFGRDYSVNEILGMILEENGYEDAELMYRAGMPSAPVRRLIDCSKAERVLGFKAKTSIREGIRRMSRMCAARFGINA